MSWTKPEWYVTPEEFAEIVIQALEQTTHFNRNEAAHPEDIVVAFTSHAEAVALGMSAAGRKMHNAEKKAVMQTGNLRKATDGTATEYGNDYSESKYRNVMIK